MLEISRPGISSTSITDYPVSDRFLTLPVENYLRVLDIIPNSPQVAIINAINNPAYRFIMACISRRLGKTYIANILANLLTLAPGMSVLIISPNYNLSQISWDLQRQLLNRFDIELNKSNAKDKVIELSNGSSVRMGSISQVDSTVGRSYDLIIFDEAALSNDGKDAFNIQLRPTLDKIKSKAIFISTPRGNNWFKEFYDRGFSSDFPQWVSIRADYTENPRVTAADILEAKKSMSTAEFKQEYEADFVVRQGLVYNVDSTMVISSLPSELDIIDIVIGYDHGYRDPSAACVVVFTSTCVYIVDEYLEAGRDTAYHAAKLAALVDNHDVGMVFIDSAAAQFRADLASIYEITNAPAKKDRLAGISAIEALIDNNKIKVLDSCVHTIKMFNNYTWKDNTNLIKETPNHDEYSHMADAVRYAIYSNMHYIDEIRN